MTASITYLDTVRRGRKLQVLARRSNGCTVRNLFETIISFGRACL